MFVVREVLPEDIDGLHEVAAHLDPVNLPNDRAVLEQLTDRSQRSFAGTLNVIDRDKNEWDPSVIEIKA